MPKGHSDKRSAEATAALEWRAIERVIPYARNPRLVSETAISKVAGSIAEFGFRQPIVVDGEGIIIVGHTRLLAAQRLGLETVPVLVAADLSPAQVKAYRIADNRTAQEAEWDLSLLSLEFEDLAAFDFDVSLTGFEPAELLLYEHGGAAGETDPYAEWEGMPEFEQDSAESVWHVSVHFKSDTDAEAFFKLIGQEKRRYTWWPESDGHVGSSLKREWMSEDGE